MKFTYDIIKSNIEVYREAKENFPIISQYEEESMSQTNFSRLGFRQFGDFYGLIKNAADLGFDLIMENMTWRKLKLILIENTENERFRNFIKNRTQRQFDEILKTGVVYDRLLNGRWVTKPGLSRRGRRTYGRRAHEKFDGLQKCIVPIMNYIIQNDIDVYNNSDGYFESFIDQLTTKNITKWYHKEKLDYDKLPKREIDITIKFVNNLIGSLHDANIDFRKLNVEYLINSVSENIKNLMIVPKGTRLKCINSMYSGSNSILTKDSYYIVRKSNIDIGGYVIVEVVDDLNTIRWCNYSNFEDVAINRNELLNELFK
jgi:hypothetical protein